MKTEEFESLVTRLEDRLDELEAFQFFSAMNAGAIIGGVVTTIGFVVAKAMGWI